MSRNSRLSLGIAIVALLLAVPVLAQLPGAPVGLSLGVKAGVTIATFHGDDAGNPENRTGFTAGAQAVLHTFLFDLQVEGLYVQKGAKDTQNGVEVTDKYDYFEVPVLLRKNLPGIIIKPYLLAGPALAFNTGAKVAGGGHELDVKDSVKDTDVGLVVGAGIANTRNHVFVEARYTLGMTKVLEDDTDVKNGTMMFMAGYSF